MQRIALVGIISLLTASVAYSQCGTPYYPAQYRPVNTYVAPVVHQRQFVEEIIAPIAIPVFIPAAVFQYLPAFQPPVPAVPASAPVTVPAGGGTQPQVQAQNGNGGSLESRIDKLIAERLENYLKRKAGGGSDDGPAIPGANGTNGTSGLEQSKQTDQNTLQKSANILAQRCASCHTKGVKVSGDVVLFNKTAEGLEYAPSVPKAKILEVTGGPNPRMPPSARGDANSPSAVTKDELSILNQMP